MIEDILEVGVGFPRKQGLFAPEKGVEDITQWSDGTAQDKQFLLYAKDIIYGLSLKDSKDLIFQRVHLIGQSIQ